jgi:hypothetical protein
MCHVVLVSCSWARAGPYTAGVVYRGTRLGEGTTIDAALPGCCMCNRLTVILALVFSVILPRQPRMVWLTAVVLQGLG